MREALLISMALIGGCDRLLPFGPGSRDRSIGDGTYDASAAWSDAWSESRLHDWLFDLAAPSDARLDGRRDARPDGRPDAGALTLDSAMPSTQVGAAECTSYGMGSQAPFAFKAEPGRVLAVLVAVRYYKTVTTTTVRFGTQPLKMETIVHAGTGPQTLASITAWSLATAPPSGSLLVEFGGVQVYGSVICAVNVSGKLSYAVSHPVSSPTTSQLELTAGAGPCSAMVDMAMVLGNVTLKADSQQVTIWPSPFTQGVSPAMTAGGSYRISVPAGGLMKWTQPGTLGYAMAGVCFGP